MDIIIRPETVTDYLRIAEVNALAFAPYIEEPQHSSFLPEFALVDALRHSANYDPELALVAEVAGDVVGHAFFYPFRMLVGGEVLLSVSLGPIAVDPAYQKGGIGGAMIEQGHRIVSQKGYAFAFLLGHPSYYPRFGYITNMFGACSLKVDTNHIPGLDATLEERLVQPEDIKFLLTVWQHWFHDVDLAIIPGTSILDWITHVEGIMSSIVVKDGERIGYLRYAKNTPKEVKMFLARDKPSTRLLIQYLNEKAKHTDANSMNLPLHPKMRAVKENLDLPYKTDLTTWEAGMVKILDEKNRAIRAYCDGVISGERAPGFVLYPPCIEFAE